VTAATTEGLLERQHGRCMRCGKAVAGRRASVHHRQRRGGGDETAPNKVILCGDGTSTDPVTGELECHGWVHANPREAREKGWIVSSYAHYAGAVPVWSHEHQGYILLGSDYEVTRMEDA
jgi:hypothetical protein